jgi:MEDS: MEthanogen/methylotroph, DcmR Sensory domain
MATALRKSGIEMVGDVPWGTHFCQFYDTKDDLLEVIVPYIKAGLESNEACVWVVSALTQKDVCNALSRALPDFERYLADQSLEIHQDHEWYLTDGFFDLDKVKQAWSEKLAQALARGRAGLRVTGDTFWLKRNRLKRDQWRNFNDYEAALDRYFVDLRMICLCSYPLTVSGAADILDVTHAHQFAVARRKGGWELVESAELKQAKSEICRLNEDLEKRVIERTGDPKAANEQLNSPW